MQNGIALTAEQQLSLIEQYGGLDAWGTDAYAPHYASAWAWAGNTPFQWGKQVASHLGGTRNGMVVSWPERIKDAGAAARRSSRTASTSGRPSSKQPAFRSPRSWTGSLRSRWRARASCTASTTPTAPERHTVQYFEIVGNRAIYKDGWWAACMLDRIPWDLSPPAMAKLAPGTYDPEQDTWELYYLPDDFSQANERGGRAPGEARRVEGALLGGGREAQRAAAAGGVLRLLRHPAAAADDHDAYVLWRRPEHRLGDDPARLRPLLRDRGGAHGARARRSRA